MQMYNYSVKQAFEEKKNNDHGCSKSFETGNDEEENEENITVPDLYIEWEKIQSTGSHWLAI